MQSGVEKSQWRHCSGEYVLITILVHWLLFIHKIFSCICFMPQVLIFRRIELYTRSIWYCHSLWEFVVACRYTAHSVYRQATTNSRKGWQYHMLHVYNCILLKMSTWDSKHVEKNILWINNNQCIKLVINIQTIHDARSEKHKVIVLEITSVETCCSSSVLEKATSQD